MVLSNYLAETESELYRVSGQILPYRNDRLPPLTHYEFSRRFVVQKACSEGLPCRGEEGGGKGSIADIPRGELREE